MLYLCQYSPVEHLSVVRSCTALNPPMHLDYRTKWTVLQFCIPGIFDHLLWNQLPLRLCLSRNRDVLPTVKLTKLKKKQMKLLLTNAQITAADSKFEGFFFFRKDQELQIFSLKYRKQQEKVKILNFSSVE